MGILYFFITLFATSIGFSTGIGGGVIIKPVLDALGHFPVENINVLSALSMFTMSIFSIFINIKKFKSYPEFNLKIIIPLGFGSVVGGTMGNSLFSFLTGNVEKYLVTVTQNIVLLILMIIIYIYMLNKQNVKSLNFRGALPSTIIGILLGSMSTFLGIGGGPINVALIILVFGYSTKLAALSSIVIIFLSQATKIVNVLLSTGFGAYNLSILPFMLVGAITGAFTGSKISKLFSDRQVVMSFNATLIIIMILCIFNIIKALGIV